MIMFFDMTRLYWLFPIRCLSNHTVTPAKVLTPFCYRLLNNHTALYSLVFIAGYPAGRTWSLPLMWFASVKNEALHP
ncbi:hypothetical protein VN97_g11147 [Penicillium thymicola]|uniref:Uncharacterized protein n=1 Tax=Penicillium thymicola TaxID=293382 RepID=A0AAI9T8F3_PENTH|nr:hypothetical protein VN97_g11147 [Penicillium thymicola]